jgi:hypothetical protein
MMKRIGWFLLAVTMAVSGVACAQAPQGASAPQGAGASTPAAVSPDEWEQGFEAIFNGTDLSGWQVAGADAWSVKDGVLECSGRGGGWIHTNAQYRDFVLRLEYKVAKDGNSGIFLRAAPQGNPAFSGMEIQVLDDYGEPPDKHSAGSLYDAVAPVVNASKPAGEWNQVEITLWGDDLTIIMNGQKLYSVNLADPGLNATQAEDRKFPNRAQVGYIGLQNHGSQVWYRNIRINEGYLPIFDGRSLDGWKTVDPNDQSWCAKDGELVCSGAAGGYIYNLRKYGDFSLRLQYRISPGGNSGVFLRVGDVNDFPGSGTEVQILDSYGSEPSKASAGAVYDLIAPSKNMARPAEQWNQFEISCGKGKLVIVMNGETIIDTAMDQYDKLKHLPAEGYIGLQNHHSPVAFRDIRVKTPSWVPPGAGVQK